MVWPKGIGQAMLEGVVYDDDGQQLSASYMDYTMPRADDLPMYKVMHQSTECPGNPLGMKGCWRGRGDWFPTCGDQCDHGCHRQQQSGHASNPIRRLGRFARSVRENSSRIGEISCTQRNITKPLTPRMPPPF